MYRVKNIYSFMYQWTYIFLYTGVFLLLFTSVNAGEEVKPVCQSEACKNTAQRILEYMDDGVKPCEDFYSFACGKFIETAVIKDGETEIDTITQLEEVLNQRLITMVTEITPDDPPLYHNVKNLYSLCMDEDKINARGVEPALARLKAAGGWPVLGNWNGENWNIIDTEIRLNDLAIGGGNLFQVLVVADKNNKDRRILKIFRGALGIYFQDLKEGENNAKVQTYFSYMVDVTEMFGADRQTATDQLKQVLLFEIELAKLFSEKRGKDFQSLSKLFTLKELKAEIGWIDWTKLLKGLIPDTVQLTEDEPITVWNVEFLKKLEKIISNYPNEVIANYMMWHATSDMVTELTTDIRNRHRKFVAEITEIDDPPSPRWKTCIYETPNIALSSLYIKKYSDEATKKGALHLTDLILQEIKLDLKEVDWMDDKTREKALIKASKIFKNIGFPDELTDISVVENFYEGLELNKDNFFEAMYDLTGWMLKKRFQRLREPPYKDDWTVSSYMETPRIYYAAYDNSINVDTGALHQPVFNVSVPHYVNFATAGFIIASELTRAFDKQGCKRNFDGETEDWCEKETIDKFQEKSKCMIKQYSQFKEKTTQINLDGTKMVYENVADNGGLKLSYRAYRRLVDQLTEPEPLLPGLEKYNQDQLFLLSMANIICSKYDTERLTSMVKDGRQTPDEFVVNGVMMNMPQFNKIFKCDENDRMHLNAKDQCAVW